MELTQPTPWQPTTQLVVLIPELAQTSSV
jgi:hypothetical protein